MLNIRSYKNRLISGVAYVASYNIKSLRIVFDKVNGCIKQYSEIKYLGLFPLDEKYGILFDRIKYLIGRESNVSDVHYN